ncbi:MAG TPA: tetratricopeptide repeat protein [Ferrovibrio sp.]|uniref:O-linked N-acetylglucosamine transferase, SPINDLY family protein n=1 Tax=Ferrovibrio sp. TaxID=1917215 RepID=UPI002ED53023
MSVSHHQNETEARNLNKALRAAEFLLRRQPKDTQLLSVAASCCENLNQPLKAAGYWKRITILEPDRIEAYRQLARLLQRLGRIDEAAVILRRAADSKAPPAQRSVALNDLGSLLQEAGRLAEAETAFRAALDLRPEHAPLCYNLGNVLEAQNRLAAAEAAYRQALARQPDLVPALNNLANLLGDAGRAQEAIALYRQALGVSAQQPDLYCNLAALMHEQGDSDGALALIDQALAIAPDHALARLCRLTFSLPVLPRDGKEADAALAAFDRRLAEWADWARQPPHRDAAAAVIGDKQPFYLAYRAGNHRDRLTRFGDVTAELMRARWGQDLPGMPVRSRPKLVIVSKHVRRHSVWTVLLEGLLRQIDRTRFETVLLHTGSAPADAAEADPRHMVERFHANPGSFAAALAILRREQPDIVYYPEIGMCPLTARLASLRLAPLQAAGWGHPITSGLPEIDLYLSGELLEPADAEAHYRERLVRLPGTGAATLPPAVAAEPLPPDIAAALPADRNVVRFILCQHAFKFDPAADALYAQILAQAAPARLFVIVRENEPAITGRLLARLRRACAAAGVDGDAAIVPLRWLPTGPFYSLLDAMDVYLDCPGFSGYTTAWQALHRGLPVVTLEGAGLRQRLAAGALRQTGCTETIAATTDAYIAHARRLAAQRRDDPAGFHARRDQLRRRAARLDNQVEVVRAFETALLQALEQRRAS